MTIGVLDYGLGNITSLLGALDRAGVKSVEVLSSVDSLNQVDGLILPGVGQFSSAMRMLRNKNLGEGILRCVDDRSLPVLGICLGMQLMCLSSSEGGLTEGLGLFEAKVEPLHGGRLRLPHMGFNQVSFERASLLWNGICPNTDFYFTHSYCVASVDEIDIGRTDYNQNFVSALGKSKLFGVQFHPELSLGPGLQLLQNFENICHA